MYRSNLDATAPRRSRGRESGLAQSGTARTKSYGRDAAFMLPERAG
jgi:hypothetical protein